MDIICADMLFPVKLSFFLIAKMCCIKYYEFSVSYLFESPSLVFDLEVAVSLLKLENCNYVSF